MGHALASTGALEKDSQMVSDVDDNSDCSVEEPPTSSEDADVDPQTDVCMEQVRSWHQELPRFREAYCEEFCFVNPE